MSIHRKSNSAVLAVAVVVVAVAVVVAAVAAVVARPAVALTAASTVVDAQAGPVDVAAGVAAAEVAGIEALAVAVGAFVGWAASPVQAEHGSVPG